MKDNMNYTNILNVTMAAPDEWKNTLGLKEYSRLDLECKKYYQPLYARYRTKKIRDYDTDYGNFVGWTPIQVGIGGPVGYKYVGYIAARMIDQVNSSNILMDRIFRKK